MCYEANWIVMVGWIMIAKDMNKAVVLLINRILPASNFNLINI